MRFDAALFDMDGTLLDTLEDLADAMNGALGEMGHPPRTLPEYRYAVGDGIEMLARRALPDGERDEASVVRCVARMRELYRENWSAKTRPYEGVLDLLRAMSGHGTPMALLSNKPEEFTSLMVRHFFPAQPFALACGARPGVPRKPDPTAAREIAGKLGVDPARVFYLGDTPTDMETARAAGMFPAGAGWGFRPEAELREAGAKAVLAHPSEVLTYF